MNFVRVSKVQHWLGYDIIHYYILEITFKRVGPFKH